MNAMQTVRTALTALTVNKLRSSLTILGVVIGVAAVIALMALGEGTEVTIAQNIEALGTDLLFVNPAASSGGVIISEGGIRGAQGSAMTFTLKDAEALADPTLAPSVLAVAPEVSTNVQVVAGGWNIRASIVGVTPEYEDVRNLTLAEGSFISDYDVDMKTTVVVLGSSVAEQLFGETGAVGQTLRIEGRQFTVIGVLQSKGGMGFTSEDYRIFAPITTVHYRISAQRTASGEMSVSSISVQVVGTERTDAAISEITEVLNDRHGVGLGEESDFSITSQEEMIATFEETTDVFVILLGAIAGISLFVGGIGVMNIMLVSVTERTREIGIRKAVGAKRRDILLQFLVEAASMSLVGGGIGVLVGWGVSSLITGLDMGTVTMEAVVSTNIIILAVSVSAAVGIIFGLYPAYRAARLSPIEALRYE
jgi:putative ABC transport system permease protein